MGILLATLCPRELIAAAPALAQVLFEAGRELMTAGRFDDACAKFAESNRIDPATGTLLNLAVCNESRGKTATAWEQFRAAEAASQYEGREDRVRVAGDHIASLEPRLSRLTIVVPAQKQLPELYIALDGVRLEHAAWNVATPIDPGEHVVLARAPGHGERVWPLRVQAGPASTSVTIELSALTAPAPSAEGDVRTRRSAPPSTSPQPKASTVDVLAYTTGALGAVGLIAGAVFGAEAYSSWDDRNRLCPADTCTSAEGRRAQRSSEVAARRANVSVGVGLVGLAVAGVLLLLPESDAAAAGAERARAAPGWRCDVALTSSSLHAGLRGGW